MRQRQCHTICYNATNFVSAEIELKRVPERLRRSDLVSTGVPTIQSRKCKVVLGLELGLKFDFEFPSFPTSNCRDFELSQNRQYLTPGGIDFCHSPPLASHQGGV